MPRKKSKVEVYFADILDKYLYKEDIQDLLEGADLPVSGRKDDLIDRLLEDAEYSPDEILDDAFYKDDLKDMCDDFDLPVSGSKDDLIERILEFCADVGEVELEEERPRPTAEPPPKVRRPQRVEIPTTGVTGTEEEFLGLIKSIEGWSPLKRHRTEEGYVMDLRQYLEYECGYRCRLEGVEMADIVVGEKFPVEVKKNPTQPSYDRLLGQLTRMHRAKNFVVGVICDVRRLEMFQDFKHQIDSIFSDGSVAIIQK